MSKDNLGTITPQTDGRKHVDREWPVICEAPACTFGVEYRVREPTTGAPWYLCAGHAWSAPYADLPAQHRDRLYVSVEGPGALSWTS